MKQLLNILLIITLSAFGLFAQSIIEFDIKEYRFEDVYEEEGQVLALFPFRNNSQQPIVISSITTSCECISFGHFEETIQPEEHGFIEILFDPANRPGNFTHTIQLNFLDESIEPIELKISGLVIPRPWTIADNYPLILGNLRLKTTVVKYYDVLNTSVKLDTLQVYNQAEYGLYIKGLTDTHESIQVRMIPDTLQSEQEGLIVVTFKVTKYDDLGVFYRNMTLLTNDSLMEEKILLYSGNVFYDFSILTKKQIRNAPRMLINDEVCNVGTMNRDATATCTFYIKNDGKLPLKILKTKANARNVLVQLETTELKRKNVARMTVELKSGRHIGEISYPITVYTNDPKNPIVVFQVAAEVIQ